MHRAYSTIQSDNIKNTSRDCNFDGDGDEGTVVDGSCSGSTAVTAVRRRQVSSQGSEVPLQVLPCQFPATMAPHLCAAKWFSAILKIFLLNDVKGGIHQTKQKTTSYFLKVEMEVTELHQ